MKKRLWLLVMGATLSCAHAGMLQNQAAQIDCDLKTGTYHLTTIPGEARMLSIRKVQINPQVLSIENPKNKTVEWSVNFK